MPLRPAPVETSSKSCTLFLSSSPSDGLERYRLGKAVYQAQVSRVIQAIDKQTGALVALKVYKKTILNELQRSQLEREVDIHRQLEHPNIVKLITAFEDKRAVYLVQEYACAGDVAHALYYSPGRRFDEIRAAGSVIVPLLEALRYMHGKGIIHRDIKTENLLLGGAGDGTLKVADFGLAIDSSEDRPGSRLGTWEYMAPEVHLCPYKSSRAPGDTPPTCVAVPTYSSAVDIWAVGVLTCELLLGQTPFENHDLDSVYDGLMMERLVLPDWLSPDAHSFIHSALNKDPDLRPSARQLLKHRWLSPYVKEKAEEQTGGGIDGSEFMQAPPCPAVRRHRSSLPWNTSPLAPLPAPAPEEALQPLLPQQPLAPPPLTSSRASRRSVEIEAPYGTAAPQQPGAGLQASRRSVEMDASFGAAALPQRHSVEAEAPFGAVAPLQPGASLRASRRSVEMDAPFAAAAPPQPVAGRRASRLVSEMELTFAELLGLGGLSPRPPTLPSSSQPSSGSSSAGNLMKLASMTSPLVTPRARLDREAAAAAAATSPRQLAGAVGGGGRHGAQPCPAPVESDAVVALEGPAWPSPRSKSALQLPRLTACGTPSSPRGAAPSSLFAVGSPPLQAPQPGPAPRQHTHRLSLKRASCVQLGESCASTLGLGGGGPEPAPTTGSGYPGLVPQLRLALPRHLSSMQLRSSYGAEFVEPEEVEREDVLGQAAGALQASW